VEFRFPKRGKSKLFYTTTYILNNFGNKIKGKKKIIKGA